MISYLSKKHFMIIPIIFLAAFVRLYGLHDRGIELWDGCLYANIAKTPILALNYIQENGWPLDMGNLIVYLNDNGGKFLAVRPGHTFLIFLSFLVFGIHEWSVLLPSALCGIASVLMIYLVGLRFFSKEAGLIAALVMTLSGFQIAMSRTSYPQADTLLLVTLFTYCYFRYRNIKKRRFLYTTGFLFGLGSFFHPSFYVVALPVLIDFFVLFSKNRAIMFRNFGYLTLFVLTPLALEEIVFYTLNHLFPEQGAWSIIQFFLYQASSSAQNTYDMTTGLKFLCNMIVWTDGVLWSIIYVASLAVSIVFVVRKRDWKTVIILSQVFLPILFWTWKYPTVKAINVCYPSISLMVGYAVRQLGRQQSLVRFVLIGAFLAISATANISFIEKQLNFQAGYSQVLLKTKKIVEHNGGIFQAKDQKNLGELLDFYMPLISKSKGTVFRNHEVPEYKLIDWRVIKDHKEYVREIETLGNLVLRERLYTTNLLPITHYHRQENKGLNYIRANIDKNWLCARLYALP